MDLAETLQNEPAVTDLAGRVVCAVDGSPQGEEAVRQGSVLAAPAPVGVVTVADPSIAVHAGWAAGDVLESIELEARRALASAGELAEIGTSTILRGDAAPCLLEHLRTERATLVAVGSHGHARAAGILVGTVAARMLHDAPCSVLIARPSSFEEPFPSRILVGIDGSRAAAAAGQVALGLAARFGAECIGLVATGGKTVDLRAADASFDGPLEEYPARPSTALVESSSEADLVIVGSRGLHGLKALGSVSERVAHRAKSSVLVVRPTAG